MESLEQIFSLRQDTGRFLLTRFKLLLAGLRASEPLLRPLLYRVLKNDLLEYYDVPASVPGR